MAQVLIRNLPDETHRALKAKAQSRGTSLEAYAREVLTKELIPDEHRQFGNLLAEIWEGADLEGVSFERDKTPYTPPRFE